MAATKKNSYKPLCSCRPQRRLIVIITKLRPILMELLVSLMALLYLLSNYFEGKAMLSYKFYDVQTGIINLCQPIQYPRLREQIMSFLFYSNLCIGGEYTRELFNNHGIVENYDDCALKAATALKSIRMTSYLYETCHILTFNLIRVVYVIFCIRIITSILKVRTPWAYILIIFGLAYVVYGAYCSIINYGKIAKVLLSMLGPNMNMYVLGALFS